MKLTKGDRQRIVDGYLAETSAEVFRAREFLEWLQPREDHPAWPVFFGRDEADLARERREQLVRHFVSDLRIRIRYSSATESGLVSFRVAEVPAFVSPLNWRAQSGGYRRVDGDDALADVRSEGARALRAWLERYRGAFEVAGYDVTGLDAFLVVVDADAVTVDAAPTPRAASA